MQIDFGLSHIRAYLTRAQVDEQGNIVLQQKLLPDYPHTSDIHVVIQPTDRVVYKKMWDDKDGIVLTADFVRVYKAGYCLTHRVHVSNRREFLAAEEDAEETGLLL